MICQPCQLHSSETSENHSPRDIGRRIPEFNQDDGAVDPLFMGKRAVLVRQLFDRPRLKIRVTESL